MTTGLPQGVSPVRRKSVHAGPGLVPEFRFVRSVLWTHLLPQPEFPRLVRSASGRMCRSPRERSITARTSMSSRWRFLVALASAASVTSRIISGDPSLEYPRPHQISLFPSYPVHILVMTIASDQFHANALPAQSLDSGPPLATSGPPGAVGMGYTTNLAATSAEARRCSVFIGDNQLPPVIHSLPKPPPPVHWTRWLICRRTWRHHRSASENNGDRPGDASNVWSP